MKHPYQIRIFATAYIMGIAISIFTTNSWAETATIPSPNKPAYLAANCTNCHGSHHKAQSIPHLTGLSATYISEQMQAFRDGKRSATVMQQIAKGYTHTQIEIIAGYFAAQPAAAH